MIKEDIQDINDDSALQSIIAIEPKTYIEKFERCDKKVYGFKEKQIIKLNVMTKVIKTFILKLKRLYIDELTFEIKELETEYLDNQVFMHGTEIDAFRTLDKNYMYTLNVSAASYRLLGAGCSSFDDKPRS
jgi:hypothetical protein